LFSIFQAGRLAATGENTESTMLALFDGVAAADGPIRLRRQIALHRHRNSDPPAGH